MNPPSSTTRTRRALAVLAIFGALAACSIGGQTPPGTVRVLAHDSFVMSDEVREAFEDETGLAIELLRNGDGVAIANQSILTAGDPLADVIAGIDDVSLARLTEAGALDPYQPDRLSDLLPSVRLDPDGAAVPIDEGAVCINVDRSVFPQGQGPDGLEDLIEPRFASELTIPDPTVSPPGQAFLLATVARYGTDGWRDYWRSLIDNGAQIVGSWDAAYYGTFSGSRAGDTGDRAIVVSYASSPPVEVFDLQPLPDESPTYSVDSTCYRQTEYAAVLAGTNTPGPARQVLDLLLSKTFQESIPLTMFVYPVVDDANLPEAFTRYASRPTDAYSVPVEMVETRLADWLTDYLTIINE